MTNISVHQVTLENYKQSIPGVVHVFRDDEETPWHRPKSCLEWVEQRVKRGFYIAAAYEGDTIVGYSEWIETYDGGKKFLYLGLMQVACDKRSLGIGTAMLADGEKHAGSIGASYLRTMPGDERAHNFYRRYGFVDTDIVRDITCLTSPEPVQYSESTPIGIDIVNSHNFIFGLTQSSGRHMYECANFHPKSAGSLVKTFVLPDGYLQFNYGSGAKLAWVLFWSNTSPTKRTISIIRALGHKAGFEELRFIFRAKYGGLFDDCPQVLGTDARDNDVEIEKII